MGGHRRGRARVVRLPGRSGRVAVVLAGARCSSADAIRPIAREASERSSKGDIVAKSRVIGLDIGTTAVRAAQLDFGGGGPGGRTQPTLVRYGEVPLPLGAVRDGEVTDQAVVSHAIRELWARTKFESKEVIIGVGNQRVVVRELALPAMPLAQIRTALAVQVQGMRPMAGEEAPVDFVPVGEGDGETGRVVHGMLVAAVRGTVSANVLAVESAGLRPTMVDLNGF